DVRVQEDRVESDEHEVGVDRHPRESQHVERNERQRAGDHDVHEMEPRAGEPVHRPGGVVDRVEPPQERHGVNSRWIAYSARSASTTISTNCSQTGWAATARCRGESTANRKSRAAGVIVRSISSWTRTWLTRKWARSVVHPGRKTGWSIRENTRSMGT